MAVRETTIGQRGQPLQRQRTGQQARLQARLYITIARSILIGGWRSSVRRRPVHASRS